MKKLYHAYVTTKMDNYFSKKLHEHSVEVIRRTIAISENNEPLIYYVLKAEEGIIDPKWELKS